MKLIIKGFSVTFHFAENDYFTNESLTKTYHLQKPVGGQVMFDHAEGTPINWKEDKDLSVTVEIKKQRHKGTNKTRTVKRTVPAETFFSFFTPPAYPTEDQQDDYDEDMVWL